MITTMKIISGLLLIITVFLNTKHGWSGLTNNVSPVEAKMFSDLGFTKTIGQIIGFLTLTGAIFILLPQTFFAGNLLNAAIILFIIGSALRVADFKLALIEVPFLLMPLIMIYLGYPFRK